MNATTTTSTSTNDSFERLLANIVKGDSNTRKNICLAFRASMNDLYESKSAERMNQLTATISAMPYWGKVKKAAIVFSGGYIVDNVKLTRYFDPELSMLRYSPKQKTWEIMPMEQSEWTERRNAYLAIKHEDYDAIKTSAKPSEGLGLDALTRQAMQLQSQQDKWNPKQRKQILQVLSALSGVLPGFELNIDTDPKALKQVGDITGQPV